MTPEELIAELPSWGISPSDPKFEEPNEIILSALRALLSRAEQAEADLNKARARVAAAYEEAAKYHDNFLMTQTGVDVEKVVASTEAIRALATDAETDALERVRREERERCALAALDKRKSLAFFLTLDECRAHNNACQDIAAAIREGSQ